MYCIKSAVLYIYKQKSILYQPANNNKNAIPLFMLYTFSNLPLPLLPVTELRCLMSRPAKVVLNLNIVCITYCSQISIYYILEQNVFQWVSMRHKSKGKQIFLFNHHIIRIGRYIRQGFPNWSTTDWDYCMIVHIIFYMIQYVLKASFPIIIKFQTCR